MARSKKVPLERRGSLTMNETKDYLGIGNARITKLIEEGRLRAYRCGREIRIITASIHEYMEAEAEEFRKSA